MGVTRENAEDVIRHHTPSEEQLSAITEIRENAHTMIDAIIELTPACADQQAAVRKVREAMMTANAAIVLDGMI